MDGGESGGVCTSLYIPILSIVIKAESKPTMTGIAIEMANNFMLFLVLFFIVWFLCFCFSLFICVGAVFYTAY